MADRPLSPRQASLECRFHLKYHAFDRGRQRGITKMEARALIRTATLLRTAESNVWVSQNRYLRVVYRVERCNVYLISLMYTRSR